MSYELTENVVGLGVINQENVEDWDIVIESKSRFFDLGLRELWRARDLISMFIVRDFITLYKQTIFGPLWLIIQPVLTTLMFMFIFGKLVGIPTDGVPPPIFYMSGILCWFYFSDCCKRVGNSFAEHQGLYSKVYFPRLVIPLSFVIFNISKFAVQLFILSCVYAYFVYNGCRICPNFYLLLLPLLVLIIAALGLGLGLIISSLTVRYRDLKYLVDFGLRLLMYLTPIIYPISELSFKYKVILMLNPVAPVIVTFKYGLWGQGYFNWLPLCYSFVFAGVLLYFGILLFNRTSKDFMDVI
ncbi:MAG: ABC transporter permease [Deltaproteobacteria bacterium]|jgi:lipopolysaccharide transport system permease protein|nr:ABC transporter permease [Deltaproteobacteria bacterium]